MTIEILLKTTRIHPQKDALKEDQCVGISVKPPNHPKRITGDKSPKGDHAPIRSLRTDEPG